MKAVLISLLISSSLFSCGNSFEYLVKEACRICVRIQSYNHFLALEKPNFDTEIDIMDKKISVWITLNQLLEQIQSHPEYSHPAYSRKGIAQLVKDLDITRQQQKQFKNQCTISNDLSCS